MLRRRLAAVGVAAALALALLLWWTLGRDRDRGGGRSGTAADATGQAGSDGRGARIERAALRPAVIEGSVRDLAGSAVSTAQVCASIVSAFAFIADDGEVLREPRCAATGADGRFRLSGLPPGHYSVDAAAPRYMPGRYSDPRQTAALRVAPGEQRTGVDIILQPGGVELSGTVKDIGGGPIEGAWVGASARARQGSGTARARSLADGSFRLWVAPGNIDLRARADGYADSWSESAAPAQAVDILLTPESTLSGRVVDAGTGKPAGGARVWTVLDDDLSGHGSGGTRSTALADEDGRFRFDRLGPGRYKPAATSPAGHGEARESVLLGLGQSADGVVIELHPALAVKGRVVVAGDERPCPQGEAFLDQRDGVRVRRATIGPDGRVSFEGVLPGRYRVSVSCGDIGSSGDEPEVVVVAGAQPPEQKWIVGGGGKARIRGTVRSASGVPVAYAVVLADARPAGGQPGGRGGSTDTQADGRFELRDLRSGTYELRVLVADQPGTAEPVVVSVSDGGQATADIQPEAGGDVSGQVVDDSGQPVAGFAVYVEATGQSRSQEIRLDGGNDRTSTGHDGSFRLRGLRAGAYRLTAAPEGLGGRLLRGMRDRDDSALVEVVAGRTARARIVVESQSGVIRGRVVDERGKPITDAFVDSERESASGPQGRSARADMRWLFRGPSTLTDTDGAFTLDKLAAGTYTVRAHRRGGGEGLVERVATGSSVTVTIRPTGSIAGSVEADGRIPHEFTIRLSNQATGFSLGERFFRTAGRFALHGLPPGSFDVSVRAAEGTAAAEIQLAEGQDLTGVVIRLAGRATVTGRLIAFDGTPLSGYMVTVSSIERDGGSSFRSGADGEASQSGADGRFAFEGAPSGRVSIIASSSAADSPHGAIMRSANVAPGRTTDLGDLRAPPGEGARVGDLGFELARLPDAADPATALPTVATIRPGGPAARSGLQVGDTIVSVDGNDVRGDPMTYYSLATVPPGTTLTLGLGRGGSVRITAAEPR